LRCPSLLLLPGLAALLDELTVVPLAPAALLNQSPVLLLLGTQLGDMLLDVPLALLLPLADHLVDDGGPDVQILLLLRGKYLPDDGADSTVHIDLPVEHDVADVLLEPLVDCLGAGEEHHLAVGSILPGRSDVDLP